MKKQHGVARTCFSLPGGILVIFAFVFSLSGCSQPTDEGPDYADDEAMPIIAEGLEARSGTLDDSEAEMSDSDYTGWVRTGVQAELDVITPLRNRQFEDADLQEIVLSYINTVDDSMDVLDSYVVSDPEYVEEWTKVYDERTSLIAQMVSDYGLTVSPEYQNVLDDLTAAGNSAMRESELNAAIDALETSLVFEKQSDGYGYFDYVAIAQNTTGYNLESVSIVLSLYDASDVKADEAYASANSWAAGETVRFEAMSEVDAVRIVPKIEFYSVAD